MARPRITLPSRVAVPAALAGLAYASPLAAVLLLGSLVLLVALAVLARRAEPADRLIRILAALIGRPDLAVAARPPAGHLSSSTQPAA